MAGRWGGIIAGQDSVALLQMIPPFTAIAESRMEGAAIDLNVNAAGIDVRFKDTAEVRWFFEGPPPESVVHWFDRLGGSREAKRTDHYRPPVDDSINVKLREGRIEEKRRLSDGSIVQLHSSSSGRVERWRKWSMKPADAGFTLQTDGHIAVTKARRLVGFGFYGEALGRVSDPERRRGCDLELTRLQIGQEHWWTICFEAFGPSDSLAATLRRAAAFAFMAPGSPALAGHHSFGYARWLLQHSPAAAR